jgi:hypothetical protein
VSGNTLDWCTCQHRQRDHRQDGNDEHTGACDGAFDLEDDSGRDVPCQCEAYTPEPAEHVEFGILGRPT